MAKGLKPNSAFRLMVGYPGSGNLAEVRGVFQKRAHPGRPRGRITFLEGTIRVSGPWEQPDQR